MAEYEIQIRAPWHGTKCERDGCKNRSEHSIHIEDDHGISVFTAHDICGACLLSSVIQAVVNGPSKIRL